MKKLEQTILIILIVTCVGMCVGSLLIALSRNDGEKDPNLAGTTQKVSYTLDEEEKIERIMNRQVYQGVMHGIRFPDAFLTNTRFLTTELERFYFVFESLRFQNPERVSCVSLTENAAPTECRFLESDFQSLARSILGEDISFSSISSERIHASDGFITCDYDASLDQQAFVFKFKDASVTGNTYEIQMELYSSIQDGKIRYDEVKNFVEASYISRQNLYGTFHVQYQILNGQKIITAVSFEKV